MVTSDPEATLSEGELMALTGYDSRGWLEKWLLDERIKYFRGKGGVLFTTIGLLGAAKQGQDKPAPQPGDPVEF